MIFRRRSRSRHVNGLGRYLILPGRVDEKLERDVLPIFIEGGRPVDKVNVAACPLSEATISDCPFASDLVQSQLTHPSWP